MRKYQILQTNEFIDWMSEQTSKDQSIIAKRIKCVQEDNWGFYRSVSHNDKGIIKDAIFELKWRDGKRIYFSKIGQLCLLLICGGNKNGQDKDIKEAKRIFIKYVEENK